MSWSNDKLCLRLGEVRRRRVSPGPARPARRPPCWKLHVDRDRHRTEIRQNCIPRARRAWASTITTRARRYLEITRRRRRDNRLPNSGEVSEDGGRVWEASGTGRRGRGKTHDCAARTRIALRLVCLPSPSCH